MTWNKGMCRTGTLWTERADHLMKRNVRVLMGAERGCARTRLSSSRKESAGSNVFRNARVFVEEPDGASRVLDVRALPSATPTTTS